VLRPRFVVALLVPALMGVLGPSLAYGTRVGNQVVVGNGISASFIFAQPNHRLASAVLLVSDDVGGATVSGILVRCDPACVSIDFAGAGALRFRGDTVELIVQSPIGRLHLVGTGRSLGPGGVECLDQDRPVHTEIEARTLRRMTWRSVSLGAGRVAMTKRCPYAFQQGIALRLVG
jgi:hypothetical protein